MIVSSSVASRKADGLGDLGEVLSKLRPFLLETHVPPPIEGQKRSKDSAATKALGPSSSGEEVWKLERWAAPLGGI